MAQGDAFVLISGCIKLEEAALVSGRELRQKAFCDLAENLSIHGGNHRRNRPSHLIGLLRIPF